ncbi:hypothetical protein V501_01008 [Pseudogymnoascus sp. VKM F-4519 (FW-2642)]|nr:hypothetical protein V501_01008 [Pseudogymnoascus sp. VKM F-4519 (FW-2642)]
MARPATMDPAVKRRRISAPAAQERHREKNARFFSSLKRPHTLNNSASHKDCNDFTELYGAVNLREKGFTSYEEAENFEEAEVDDEDTYEEEAPEANMEATRQKLDNKLKSAFEAIFEKYGKDFSGVGDEIDLRTGAIIVDNGHLAEMHNETDAGEGRARGILRAYTEEPERAGLSRHGLEDNAEDYHDVDEASDSMDYHARGRQMLRASTQEPDLGQQSGTEEDEKEYNWDIVGQNAATDDDSSDDDILYQNSGVIPANSLAPLPMPPKPPINYPQSQPLKSPFQIPKPAPNSRSLMRSSAYPSKPNILAQFGQELGPRIVEYVFRPKGHPLWAPERKRHRRQKVGIKDQDNAVESETVVRDREIIERVTITRSRVPAESPRRSPENVPIVPSHNSSHPVRRSPESAPMVVSHSEPRESLASENADQSMNDNELLGPDNNEPDSDWERDDSASDSAQNFKLRKRTGNKNKRKPFGRKSQLAAKPRPGRKTYTEEDDQALLAWVEWVRTETNYPLWSAEHWNMFSEKNARHTGPAWQQHYRKSLEISGDQHLFPRIMMADKATPKTVRKRPRPSGDGGSVVGALEFDEVAKDYPNGRRTRSSIVGAPGLNQPTEDESVAQQISPRTEMTHEDAPEPRIVEPRILADKGSAVKKRRRGQAVGNRLSGDIRAPQELPGTGESAKTGQWEQFKHTIRQLYILEDYTLNSVMKIMMDQHAFQAHKALYKAYLSKWGFKKNRMNGELGSMSVTGLHQDAKGRPDDAARDPQKPSRGQPGYKWWNEPQYEGLSRVEAVYKKRKLERAAKRKARVGARGSASVTRQYRDDEKPHEDESARAAREAQVEIVNHAPLEYNLELHDRLVI